MGFSFRHFFSPAPARVQRATALLKLAGGLLTAAAAAEYTPPARKPACFFGGLVVCAVAEGLEKLWPPAAPETAEPPADEAG
ncbi:hypothetical protein [Hymenobacter sp.]|uniref:hypothetical protein n=1 Tax=Hymenobacter sp. TaxID=1898978 RepID=UPI00286BEE9B|nr:hypothetical protein [Hymenobacter sp.]